MALFFSILPPPIGTEGINVPLIPDIEEILKFSDGDIGIADTIKKNFLYKTMAAGKFDSLDAIKIFCSTGGFTTDKDLETYETDGGRFRIPVEDITLDGNDSMGLKALEKVTLKSIFETQKPYMEFIPTAIKVLAELEQIAAKVLTIVDTPVKKPKFNKRSLTYKLNESQKELNQMFNFSKKKSDPFKNLTTEDKISGLDLLSDLTQPERTATESFADNDLENLDWEIISTEYSTGEYIVGVDYKTIYRNIVDPKIILDNSADPEIEVTEEKPAVITFAYYNNSGDEVSPPRQWLNRTFSPGSVGPSRTKWHGRWEQLEDNDHERYRRFLREFVDDRLFKKIGRKDAKLSNEAYAFIEPKIDPKEFVKEANKNCFMNSLPKLGKSGLNLGADSVIDVDRVTKDKRKMFLPKKINFNGKQVIIDPEADYELQLIKLVPTKEVYYNGEVDRYNQNLKKTTPIVGNYMGIDVRDALTKSEYDVPGYRVTKPTTAKARRVQRALKYKFDASDNTNVETHDDKVSYVIEGVLRDNPKKQAENEANGGNGVGQSGNSGGNGGVNLNLEWYLKPSFYTAVKDFIDILLIIFIDVVPEISSIVKLFSSPHEFLFDVFFEKIEESFDAFSGDLMKKFTDLKDFDDKFERADYIRNDDQLNKFVSLDEELNYKFILDGFSGMELLGFNFGINIMSFLPKMVLNKSSNEFSLNQRKENINGNTLPTQPNNAVVGNDGSGSSGSTKGTTSGNAPDPVNANVRKLQDDGTYKWETVSVEYSTGEFIQGTDYNYIYISEDVDRLLSRGDDLFEAAIKSKDPLNGQDQAIDALTNYNMAQEKDPNNEAIKEKIKELKDKFRFDIQMILQFLMNFVSFPIKLVISMLEEWKDFFKEMATIVKIPDKLTEFLSFDWITKYTKPTGMLELLGLRFKPQLLFEWLTQIQTGVVDPTTEFDLSEVVSAPFIFQLPKVNAEQLNIMKTSPLKLMTSFFKLIQMLVEGILCFIWNTLNLDSIIPCPKFEISKFAAADLPLEELQALLNGESGMLNPTDGPGGSTSASNADGSTYNSVPYKFVYDVKLQDGTVIKDLNYAELQDFMNDNQEFNYEVL